MSDLRVSGNTFADFAQYVHNTDTVITPYLCGFVNIEGGHLSIAGKLFPECDDCNGYSSSSMFVECATCGRNKSQYIHIRAGYGDGVYPVFDLAWGNAFKGTITFCDEGSGFANDFFNVPAGISDGSLPVNESMNRFWDFFDTIKGSLDVNYLGTISAVHDSGWSTDADPFGTYYFADSGVGLDPTGSLVASKDIRLGRQDVYIFSERNPENLNALIPQVILTLDPELAKEIGLPSGQLTLDIEQEATTWGNATVFSNMGGGLATAAVAINIQYESAILGKGFWDELSEHDHLLISLSWRLLYDQLNNEPESKAEEFLVEYPAERVYQIFMMRGMITRALNYFNPTTNQVGPAYAALQAKFGAPQQTEPSTLSQPGKGLGGGGSKIGGGSSLSGSSPLGGTSSSPLAKFCSSCGTAFTDDAHRFCGQCGAAR